MKRRGARRAEFIAERLADIVVVGLVIFLIMYFTI